jgi:hypothetical protein
VARVPFLVNLEICNRYETSLYVINIGMLYLALVVVVLYFVPLVHLCLCFLKMILCYVESWSALLCMKT